MPRLLLAVFVVLAVLLAAGCGGSDPEPSGRGAVTGPLFGFSDGAFRTPALAEPVAELQAKAGAQVVRVPVRWAEIQPQKGGPYDWKGLDAQLQSLAARQIRPLLLVTSSPTWAHDPADRCPDEECPPGKAFLDEWAAFLSAMVEHTSPTQPIGVEVWNEPNFRINWHTKKGPDARRYSQLVRVASRAIRKLGRGLVIVLGGLAPTAAEPPRSLAYGPFLREVYRRAGSSTFDAIGLHPYTSPDAKVPAPGLPRFRRALRTVRDVRGEAGDRDKPLWLTEVGFYTGMPARGAIPARAGEVSEVDQANGLLALYEAVEDAEDVRAFLVFRLRDDAASRFEAGFGVVRSDNSPKPAYEALRQRFGPQ